MKKCIAIAVCITLLAIVFTGCTSNSSEQVDIEGEWQAYASLVDDEIVPFEDDQENESQLLNQSIVFKDDDKVLVKNGEVSLDGTYKHENEEYIVTVPFGNSNEVASFSCIVSEENLIVTMIPPEGFEDYDSGNPTVYKKMENQ